MGAFSTPSKPMRKYNWVPVFFLIFGLCWLYVPGLTLFLLPRTIPGFFFLFSLILALPLLLLAGLLLKYKKLVHGSLLGLFSLFGVVIGTFVSIIGVGLWHDYQSEKLMVYLDRYHARTGHFPEKIDEVAPLLYHWGIYYHRNTAPLACSIHYSYAIPGGVEYTNREGESKGMWRQISNRD